MVAADMLFSLEVQQHPELVEEQLRLRDLVFEVTSMARLLPFREDLGVHVVPRMVLQERKIADRE